ncbi:MAG: magnesium chelatase [Deltaproteobacteria bacterium CG03_land_8_20_14_0_80_45_14]|nr:MAG: magnesium chelatase [Deltaproteobacteria bacterium CG03_land_8_20_14_0_80_45_14]
MTFSDFVGHEDAKLALILNVSDTRCGGVLFIGEKGSGKSTLARFFKNILPEDMPFVEMPLNVTEEALLGGIDIEATIKAGKRIIQKGILSRADGGVVYIDDINLLSPELVALILEAQGRGENIIEREGVTLKHPSRFILVASMNPEEGALSPHLLDRFGMCVVWEGLKETSMRIEIMKKRLPEVFTPDDEGLSLDEGLRLKINASRTRLNDVIITQEINDYIVQLCLESSISGHRGDIFLLYAARAYAVFCEDEEVTEKHVDEVLPLVLTHRKRILQQMEEQQREHQEEKQQSKQDEHTDRQEQSDPKSGKNNPEKPLNGSDKGMDNADTLSKELSPHEEVFPLGNTFKTRHFVFRKDRLNRFASGRRTKTRSKDKGGRYVKSILQPRNDIAIDATIRAAAPYQKIRGRENTLLICEEDLRYRQRERKMGHLVVFVVDGSASMGVQRRMVETKGAVQSLLLDCYQKRDKVSMIVFRKDKAEVILPPTSSVEMASRRLREVPVGGKTPLTAGLLEAYKLIRRFSMKSPETRFLLVLITDGRANQTMTDTPVRDEIKRVVDLLNELHVTDFIVVDTEDKKGFIKTDLALQIASQLRANYYTVENIKSEFLTELVQIKRKGLS